MIKTSGYSAALRNSHQPGGEAEQDDLLEEITFIGHKKMQFFYSHCSQSLEVAQGESGTNARADSTGAADGSCQPTTFSGESFS